MSEPLTDDEMRGMRLKLSTYLEATARMIRPLEITIDVVNYRRLTRLAEAAGDAELANYLKSRFRASCEFKERRARLDSGGPVQIGCCAGED